LGLLFEHLRAADAYDDAWIVVTSDHGRPSGSTGCGGTTAISTRRCCTCRWIVKPPVGTELHSRAGAVFEGFVSTIDVLPSLAQWLGLDGSGNLHLDEIALGASFADAADHPERRELILRANHTAPHVGVRRAAPGVLEKSIVWRTQGRGARAVITSVAGNDRFDLLADPFELESVGRATPRALSLLEPCPCARALARSIGPSARGCAQSDRQPGSHAAGARLPRRLARVGDRVCLAMRWTRARRRREPWPLCPARDNLD